MQDEKKIDEPSRSLRWQRLREEAKDDPRLLQQLEAAERVMEQYRDTLRQLADS